MRNINFIRLNIAVVAMVAMLAGTILTGCNDPFSQTPEEDTTMLWPAADSTGYWGFINEKGEMVIPAKYDRTYGFSGGVAKVIIDEDDQPTKHYYSDDPVYYYGTKQAFINKKGEVVYTLPDNTWCDSYFYYGCCRYWYHTSPYIDISSYGMYDAHFNSIISNDRPGLVLSVMTKDGLASSNIGYFNKKGEKVISRFTNGVDGELYFQLYDFCDGIAVVDKSWYDGPYNHNAFGAINTKGEVVIDTIYPYLQSVGNDRLLYKLKDSDWTYAGLMDTQGNIITEQNIYLGGENFFGDGGLMPVRNNQGLYGYIDKNGIVQIPYQYAYADPFYGEYAWVWKSTTMSIKSTEVDVNLYCIINLQGEVVLSMDTWDKMPASLISSGVHNELCLVVDTENPRLNVYKYINLKGEVIYSWSKKTNRQGYDAPERREQTEADRDELMLRMFEGTKYYPLAEQCVRSRRAHAERE
ncbi:MAG: WG repeat-containing protein [Paludibacteraceae bacterium]|nr:WG repeat-containing protein [Paludibacteraceae bacterium]